MHNSLKFHARLSSLQGGYSEIFIYTRRLAVGPFLGVQNYEFQYFWWFCRKMNIFWGYDEIVDIVLGS